MILLFFENEEKGQGRIDYFNYLKTIIILHYFKDGSSKSHLDGAREQPTTCALLVGI